LATSSDKQRLEAFVRRSVRLHLYRSDDPTAAELVTDVDDNLFATVLKNEQRVLSPIHTGDKVEFNTVDFVERRPSRLYRRQSTLLPICRRALHYLLPDRSSHCYSLRHRRHGRSLEARLQKLFRKIAFQGHVLVVN